METATPDVQQARDFARNVRADFPDQMLAYNLSPSFNWDAEGVFDGDAAIESYTGDLARLGFVWQFITLAGFHSNGLATHNFVQEYAKRGMGAYVEMIQREERRLGVETLTHQKWSGAALVDAQLKAVQTNSSTLAMGAGVTEGQFGGK